MANIDPRLDAIIDCLYRVSAKAIIFSNGKLLVVKEPEGWYGLPGGGIDHGASIKQTIERELGEEIGIKPEHIELDERVLFVSHHEILRGTPRVNLFYKVSLLDPENIMGKELSFKWVRREELREIELSASVDEARDFLLKQF